MVVRSENFQSPSVSGGAGFERLPWFDFPLGVDVSDQCHAPVLQGDGGDVAKWKMKNGNFSPNVQNAE